MKLNKTVNMQLQKAINLDNPKISLILKLVKEAVDRIFGIDNLDEIFGNDLIKDIGNSLFNISNDYIYDFDSDSLYEIICVLKGKNNLRLKSLKLQEKDAILIGNNILELVDGFSNIYIDYFQGGDISIENEVILSKKSEHKYYTLSEGEIYEINYNFK